ncbi:putative endo-1,3(4)-beta-glucanase [Cladobotryum mycophilum]|uniref:Endo-1,3(4)-beta-glucanase n=1 Tax=Cladobotryum mycophilum TaxID=491253 RepID=A0ABR0S4X7_9HYPO
MAPSIAALSTAILACAGSAVATQFSLTETYDSSNFVDKFNFFTDSDPNAGFVVYQGRDQALAQGLVAVRNNEVYVGVDHTTVLRGPGYPGRNSVRLESKASYKRGLIVARFTHLPFNRCGTWPSFWTLGNNWPGDGEIDLYEGWNDYIHNAPALHVGNSTQFGACRLDGANQTSPVQTSNCDNTYQNPPQQYLNQGCTAAEYNSPWASSSGGTYAIEWTSQYIKLYNFFRGREPANLGSSNPDTSSWGAPSVFLKGSECDIDRHFQNQRLIMDITFCGNPAGTDDFWRQACSSKTGKATCADYVAGAPGDFVDSYFQIQDIRYFSEKANVVDNEKRYEEADDEAVVVAVVAETETVSEPAITYASSGTGAPAPVTTTGRWTNTTVTAAPTSVDYTTSTVYTTSVHTITKCPPYVVDCPSGGYVTTETIPLYTTVCPVTATEVPAAPQPTATEGAPDETITTKVTRTYTITSCAPTVTNCPVGSTTTEVITTTYCPGKATGVPTWVPSYTAPSPQESATEGIPAASAPAPSAPADSPAPAAPSAPADTPAPPPSPPPPRPAPGNGNGSNGTTYVPQPSSGVIQTPGNPAPAPAPTGQTPGEGCTGPNCPPPTNSSVRAGVSTIALVSALVAMLL